MNEELEKQLSRAIEKALDVAESTGEFVIEQAPELLREFYAWHFWSSVFCIVIFVLVALIPFIFKYFAKEEKGHYTINFLGKQIDDDLGGIFYALSIVLWIASSVVIFCNTYDLLKLLVSPKLYLIEYFLN